MKNFLQGTLKICLAIVGSIVVLAVIGALVAWGIDAYNKNQARPYEQVKLWEQDLTDPLRLKMEGKTKLVNGTMYAEFTFDGYPAYLTASSNRSNDSAGFNLSFKDADGFEIRTHKLKLSEALTITNKGKPAGLRYTFEEYVPVEIYARFHQVQVTWQLDTEPPPPPRPAPARVPVPDPVPAPSPKPDAQPAVEDHCAPGLSREERIRRLGERGTLRQTGEGQYSAGTGSLFFYQNSLISCR